MEGGEKKNVILHRNFITAILYAGSSGSQRMTIVSCRSSHISSKWPEMYLVLLWLEIG